MNAPNNDEVESNDSKTFLEFFAGIGLVHLGLRKSGWQCVYANDISPKKREMYIDEFPDADYYHQEDVWKTEEVVDRITEQAFLATASFPCTDLSVAGNMKGLEGSHSGSLFGFTGVLEELRRTQRLPKITMIENVVGLLTGRNGEDFNRTCQAMADLGYYLDAVIVDAKYFTPQSRPRLFIVAVAKEAIPATVAYQGSPLWEERLNHRKSICNVRLREAMQKLQLSTGWIAFDLPELEPVRHDLKNMIDTGDDQEWWSEEEVHKHMIRTSESHRQKIEAFRSAGMTWASTMFRRIREGTTRVEARFDGIGGCLRTANGGSARQIVIFVHDHKIRMRWMTPREYARLQGAPEFNIQRGVNQSLTGFGDGVCVPAIEWLDNHILSIVASHLDDDKGAQCLIAQPKQQSFAEIASFNL